MNLKKYLARTVSYLGIVLAISLLSPSLFAAEIEYTVPVSDSSLEPYATFKIKDFISEIHGGKRTIGYSLPKELTGVPVFEIFEEKVNNSLSMVLNSPHAQMICWYDGCRCDVQYHSLRIDPKDIESFLSKQNLSPSEMEARMFLGIKFSGDPGGRFNFCL